MGHVQFAKIGLLVNITGQFRATGARDFFGGQFAKISVTIVDSKDVAKSTKTNATHADIVDTRNVSESE